MHKSRFGEEQIIGVLREQEAWGRTEEVCRRHRISTTTFYKWKARYGGLEVSEARRLKALEDENRRLKKLLAEAVLDVANQVRPHSAHGGLTPAEARLLAAGARPGLVDGPAARPWHRAPAPAPAINPKDSLMSDGRQGSRSVAMTSSSAALATTRILAGRGMTRSMPERATIWPRAATATITSMVGRATTSSTARQVMIAWSPGPVTTSSMAATATTGSTGQRDRGQCQPLPADRGQRGRVDERATGEASGAGVSGGPGRRARADQSCA